MGGGRAKKLFHDIEGSIKSYGGTKNIGDRDVKARSKKGKM